MKISRKDNTQRLERGDNKRSEINKRKAIQHARGEAKERADNKNGADI